MAAGNQHAKPACRSVRHPWAEQGEPWCCRHLTHSLRHLPVHRNTRLLLVFDFDFVLRPSNIYGHISVHSWQRYSAAPLGNQATNFLTMWQSHYPYTEPTSPCTILIMPNVWLGNDRYKNLQALGVLIDAHGTMAAGNQHAKPACRSVRHPWAEQGEPWCCRHLTHSLRHLPVHRNTRLLLVFDFDFVLRPSNIYGHISVHSWQRYSAAPLGNQATNFLTMWQSHYPYTEPTSPCTILIMPNVWLGNDRYKNQ